ncbi:hypothetical protein KGQ34_04605 [Patescibacteria group bacterium]|nr:hypothetical protein [Patescibacteria group bacterium]
MRAKQLPNHASRGANDIKVAISILLNMQSKKMKTRLQNKLDFNDIADGIYIGTNQCCQTHFDETLKKPRHHRGHFFGRRTD